MAKKKPMFDVFVGNLPSNVTEQALAPLFTEVGEVSSIRLCNKKGVKSAVVRYFFEPDAEAAVAKRNGFLFGNNTLDVHRMERSTRPGQAGVNPGETSESSMDPMKKAATLSAVLGAAHSKRNLHIARGVSSDVQNPSEKAEVELLISEVKDLTSFFGQQHTDVDRATELGVQLAKICPTAMLVTSPECDKIYAAKFSEDGQWYRCKIVQKIDDSKSYVQYLDYGNCEEVRHQSGLVCLTEELALIPPLAISCCFDGLQSLKRDDDPALYDKALAFVNELLRDNMVKVVTSTKISRQATNMVTSCRLLDSGVDVIEEVLSRGYAKKMQARTEDATPIGGSGLRPSDDTAVPPRATFERAVKPSVMPQSPNWKNQPQVNSADSRHDRGYQIIPDFSSYPARDTNYNCDRGYSNERNYQQGFGRGFHGDRSYVPDQHRSYSAPLFRPEYPGSDGVRNNNWFRPHFYPREQAMTRNSGGQAWMMNPPELRMVPARSMQPAAPGGSDTSVAAVKQLSDERNSLKSQLKTMEERIKALEAQIAANDALCHSKNDCLSKLAHIFELLEKVKLQREQFSSDPDVKDIFEMALDIYDTCRLIAEPNHTIDAAVARYQEAQDAIRKCNDLDQLPPLRAERDVASEELRELLQGHKAISKAADQTNSSRVVHIKAALTELKHAYGELLEVSGGASLDIPDVPLTFDELSQSIEKLKVEVVPGFQKQREKTDAARAHLVTVLQELQQALGGVMPGSAGKQFSVSCLDAAVEDLQCCLQAEVSACNLISSASCGPLAALVRQLVTELQRTLNRASNAAFTQDRYSSLLEELGLDCAQHGSEDSERKAMEACQLQRNLRKLKSALRHRLADLEDVEPCDELERNKVAADIHAVRIKLQGIFREEEQLLDELSQLQNQRFPELALLCPELELPQYQKYNGLLKSQWELIAFDTEAYGRQLKTKFCAEDMTITEYSVDTHKDLDVLLTKITQYSSTCCSHLLRIRAVFASKDQRHAYVMVPSMGKPLMNHGQPLLHHLKLLHDILTALLVLHTPAKGKPSIAHGRVHPAWLVVCDDGQSVALDLPNFSVYMQGKNHQLPVAGGIDFTAPELRTFNAVEPTPASDMFAFGCLILWLLFPGAQLKHGCLQSLGPADENCSQKEVPVIRSLLKENPNDRPTAAQLLENPIFTAFNKKLNQGTAVSTAVKAKLTVAETLSLPL
uniref:Protein containing TUDOR and RRM domain n=1 Tax=Rhipicephalus zambeziensis TaxID=60191 RepID=A0A224YYP6_9ACAR